MQLTHNFSLISVPWAAPKDPLAPYRLTGISVDPSLVLDFEAGVYILNGAEIDLTDIMTFSRNGPRTVIDEQSNSVVVSADLPAFDWSSGRRGLLIQRQATGGAADLATCPIVDFWDPGASTLFVEGSHFGSFPAFRRLLQIDGGTSENDRISFYHDSSLAACRPLVYAGGVLQSHIATNNADYPVAAGANYKIALACKTDSFAVSGNGGAALEDVLGTAPMALSTLRLARGLTGADSDQIFYKIICYPDRLGNSQLPTLTA